MTHYGEIFTILFRRIHRVTDPRLVYKLRKLWQPKTAKVVRYLPDKKKNKNSPRSPALASARIAPKICQDQLQTMHSQCSRLHPNRFTFGGVIAERVNAVETHRKVFPIFGRSLASRRIVNKFHSLDIHKAALISEIGRRRADHRRDWLFHAKFHLHRCNTQRDSDVISS